MIEIGTEWVCATIVNLSAAGALLRLPHCDTRLLAGDTFKLFFDNGGQSLQLTATAIRTDGMQIGFKFSGLSPDSRRAIETKLIRLAVVSARISPIDGNEVPQEPEISQPMPI